MDDISLILGPVVFQDFEATAGIRFGGEQHLAVHKLPGGGRVIDVLGRDDAEIVLAGTFSGDDATLRARALDELRVVGSVLPLTWDIYFYSVIIRDFVVDYRNPYWVPYRLCCTVLRDEAGAVIDTVLSLGSSLLADVGAAIGQGITGLDLSSVQSSVAASNATTLGTPAYNTAFNALETARTQIDTGLSSAGADLDGASAIVASTSNPAIGADALQSATTAAGRLGNLATARGYIGRAGVNIAAAST